MMTYKDMITLATNERKAKTNKTKIVAVIHGFPLCEDGAEAVYKLIRDGYTVITRPSIIGVELTEDTKKLLEENWRQSIKMSDMVYVVNPEVGINDDMFEQIFYAAFICKKIVFMNEIEDLSKIKCPKCGVPHLTFDVDVNYVLGSNKSPFYSLSLLCMKTDTKHSTPRLDTYNTILLNIFKERHNIK